MTIGEVEQAIKGAALYSDVGKDQLPHIFFKKTMGVLMYLLIIYIRNSYI